MNESSLDFSSIAERSLLVQACRQATRETLDDNNRHYTCQNFGHRLEETPSNLERIQNYVEHGGLLRCFQRFLKGCHPA